MSAPIYKNFEQLLKKLHKIRNSGTYMHFINSISNKVIYSIIEIAYNILKGDIPINKRHLMKLKTNKQNLKLLINKRVSMKVKRNIIKNNSKFVRNILDVVFSFEK